MYKLPKTTTGDSSNGTNFLYMDKNSPSFSNSQLNISSENNNPLYNTLRPLYEDPTGIKSYAMYNDQPPMASTRSNKAHSKGAVAFNATKGFWIISSVPRFPANVSIGYNYGKSQTKKGQIILCVTVPGNMEDKIKEIFKTTKPFIYDEKNFTLESSRENDLSYMYMNFRTSGNVPLKVFAKPKSCEDDIYSHFIAPMLQQKLLVQSWMAKLEDDNWVEGVKHVRFDNQLAFHTNVDHSKWAVASTRGVPWTCIGDLNRDKTQFRRGGLALCLNDVRVANAFRKLYRMGVRNPPPETPRRNTCRNVNRINQIHVNTTRRECRMEQLQ